MTVSLGRRACVCVGLLFPWLAHGLVGVPTERAYRALDMEQSQRFRAWFVRIVAEQLKRGPTPRWYQRDCAGLVRFAVAESLKLHDAAWLRANGLHQGEAARNLPLDVRLSPEQRDMGRVWVQENGEMHAYASAIALIQGNTNFVGKDINQAQPGDLLFYDQGNDQHLMIWMGSYVAYHTGTVTDQDHGLRQVSIPNLLAWRDNRWHPVYENPNFIGVFKFDFLSG